MSLTKSEEDYLETIFILEKEKDGARIVDIAKMLNVKLPSVTEAMRKLARKKLVNYKRYNKIKLTKEGEKFAKIVFKKHRVLFDFFTKLLGVDEKTAMRDACLMEHSLSSETLNKLIKFVKKHRG